ncbi:MAG: ATP-binding protein, partial [Longimicrobiales bacterium]
MAVDGTALWLGEELNEQGERAGTRVDIDPAHLTTHGVVVGMTGSGKTGLGVVLLEEALVRGIPTLILDPKGDMGNLLLNFPELRAADFRPWVDEAADGGPAADTAAQRAADAWREGLAGWGIDGERMRRLGASADFTIYTPGSESGVALNVLGSLQPPVGADTESRTDEIEAFVSGLLTLIGRPADPVSGREHILLSNLIDRAWQANQAIDLATLVAQVATPPIRKLGVFELDTFFPPADRMQLAIQLNALLASPSFATWLRGAPLDMENMLRAGAGRARAAIVYLAHLSDSERQFVVTLVLSKLVSWMRRQPGTSDLRALVYMDEVFGFAPPTAAPPSKKPILTILKQARAHGVGLVLSTQNPVDLDYKAMSNAGTWMIGRLQTERDKARILE